MAGTAAELQFDGVQLRRIQQHLQRHFEHFGHLARFGHRLEIRVYHHHRGQHAKTGDGQQRIEIAEHARLRGLQAYHGSAQHLRAPAARAQAIAAVVGRASQARDALRAAGFACDEISGGGTGTFAYESGSGVYTEIQPGSYALMDLDYRANEADVAVPAMRQAIGVLVAVMSVRGGHAVLDGGLKAVSVDSGLPSVRLPGWRVRGVSDEHTVIEPVVADRAGGPGATAAGGSGAAAASVVPALGQRCVLDPWHCDPTVNLHDWVVAYRGERVEVVWPVLPRSASR